MNQNNKKPNKLIWSTYWDSHSRVTPSAERSDSRCDPPISGRLKVHLVRTEIIIVCLVNGVCPERRTVWDTVNPEHILPCWSLYRISHRPRLLTKDDQELTMVVRYFKKFGAKGGYEGLTQQVTDEVNNIVSMIYISMGIRPSVPCSVGAGAL